MPRLTSKSDMTAQAIIDSSTRKPGGTLKGEGSLDSTQTVPLKVDAALLEELHDTGFQHYARLLIFLALYVLAAFSAFWIAQTLGSNAWVYLINFPLYLLAAASLHGISLFTHEGVHGTLSESRWWNRALSIACALPVLQNYSAYKVLHLRHHHHHAVHAWPGWPCGRPG